VFDTGRFQEEFVLTIRCEMLGKEYKTTESRRYGLMNLYFIMYDIKLDCPCEICLNYVKGLWVNIGNGHGGNNSLFLTHGIIRLPIQSLTRINTWNPSKHANNQLLITKN
jgi:hypothetical protein